MRTWDSVRDEMWPPGSARRRHLDHHLSISRRTDRYLHAVLGWMLRIPVAGRVAYCFWYALHEHDMERPGIRWANALDALSFSFLNDGMRPTAWHTWIQMRRPSDDRYNGIYPGGAPRNRREADDVIAREPAA